MELSAIDPKTRRTYTFMAEGTWGVWFSMNRYGEMDSGFEHDLIDSRVWIDQKFIDSGVVQVGLDEIISDNYVPQARGARTFDADEGEYGGLAADDVFSAEELIEVVPRREQIVAIEQAFDQKQVDWDRAHRDEEDDPRSWRGDEDG